MEPWKKPNDHGELPGDICCQRATSQYCYDHNKNNYLKIKGTTMKNRTIRVEIMKTIQPDQFEPLKAVASITGTIEDDEDYASEARQARNLCREQVEEELNEWIE